MIKPRLGRLLIVDDEVDVTKFLCEILTETGYETLGVTSGKEALEALKDQTFDLLLADLVMPEMDGIELLHAALEIDPHLICIIITGKGTIQTAVEAMKVGAFDYLLKPLEWKTMKPILSRAMKVSRLRDSHEQLRNFSAYLQSAIEKERMNIAREIHDELGQALTSLKMDLFWLENRIPKDQKLLLEKTNSMSRLVDETIKTVQRISTELRPGLLDDLGLVAAIEWQAEEFQKRTGIKCEVTLDPEDIILDQNISITIFRIFQETLTNVARHSNATMVEISLNKKADKIVMEVRDNGKGITEGQISNPKSFGLIGIQERVYHLEGEVSIIGVQDKGTTVTVSIPLNKER